MTQLLATFLWMVMVISALQVSFFIWLAWPSLKRSMQPLYHLLWQKTHCAWCWEAWHIRSWMPSTWTSCLCQHHYRIEKARLAARRAARLATRPPVTVRTIALEETRQERVQEQMEVLV